MSSHCTQSKFLFFQRSKSLLTLAGSLQSPQTLRDHSSLLPWPFWPLHLPENESLKAIPPQRQNFIHRRANYTLLPRICRSISREGVERSVGASGSLGSEKDEGRACMADAGQMQRLEIGDELLMKNAEVTLVQSTRSSTSARLRRQRRPEFSEPRLKCQPYRVPFIQPSTRQAHNMCPRRAFKRCCIRREGILWCYCTRDGRVGGGCDRGGSGGSCSTSPLLWHVNNNGWKRLAGESKCKMLGWFNWRQSDQETAMKKRVEGWWWETTDALGRTGALLLINGLEGDVVRDLGHGKSWLMMRCARMTVGQRKEVSTACLRVWFGSWTGARVNGTRASRRIWILHHLQVSDAILHAQFQSCDSWSYKHHHQLKVKAGSRVSDQSFHKNNTRLIPMSQTWYVYLVLSAWWYYLIGDRNHQTTLPRCSAQWSIAIWASRAERLP